MDATLRCSCGTVAGLVQNVSPKTVNRVVCYCDDCQAFLRQLARADLLDPHGGSDIVQVAPASLAFVRGHEHIVGLRLSPKGLHRFYASCCRTPLGNTVSPGIPFVGVVAQAFENETHRADELFGPPVGRIFGKYAIGKAPGASNRINLGFIARVIAMVLGWRLRGRTWPHPFFDRVTRGSRYPITTISREQREALRVLCGPAPSARS